MISLHFCGHWPNLYKILHQHKFDFSYFHNKSAKANDPKSALNADSKIWLNVQTRPDI